MKYDQKYSEFFSLLYLLFGSAVLNVLRGPGHFGTVVSKENSRSLYDPTMSKYDFAVPSVNHLKEVNYGYKRCINSGVISKSVNMCKTDPNKEFVISSHGMHVSQGSKGKIDGDVDLWEAEGIPNVHSAAKHLASDIKASEDLLQDTPKITVELRYLQLENVLQRMSHCCETIRKRLTRAYFLEKKIEKMHDSNPNKKDSYQWSLGRIYTLSTELENCINRALNINLDISKEMAHINTNLHCFSDSKFVQLYKQFLWITTK